MGKTQILVIEDETIIRDGIADILSTAGHYEVITAPDGRVGLALAQAHQPDLILCDVNMPRMNGYELLQAVRREKTMEHIPFVFLTANRDRQSQRHGMKLGADDYLTKPFTPEELLVAVRVRLEKQARLDQQIQTKMEDLRQNILLAVPHELRTPLTKIIGFGDILMLQAETMEREEIASVAEMIVKGGITLQRVIENYVSYIQLELINTDSGMATLFQTQEQTRPDEIVRQVVEEWMDLSQRQIEITLTAQVELSVSPRILRKIVLELVDNALKFSAEKTAVTVHTYTTGDNFYLVVRDQWRGMTAEQIEQVGAFMQFERQEYEQQGSGLGLILARRLVELHRGQLMIESVPEVETVVTVSLPHIM